MPEPTNSETTVWRVSPSQALNFGTYVLCILFCWLIVPIFIGLWRWMEVRSIVYELTTERLRFTNGVFNKRTEEMELYRVQDTTLEEPFFLRLFKAGNVIIRSHDASTPMVVLRAVPDANRLRDQLRQNVELIRTRKGVRAMELE